MLRICFALCLILWQGLSAQPVEDNLFLEFQQARVRNDYKEALERCDQILDQNPNRLSELIRVPDFYTLASSQSSLLPLSPTAIRTLLRMQAYIYQTSTSDSIFWLKERGLTALFYQYELKDSLRPVLRAILEELPEESPYILMDSYGESLLADLRAEKLDKVEAVEAFSFWDNLYRNLDLIYPHKRESAEDLHLLLVDELSRQLPSCEELESEYRVGLRMSLLRPIEYEYLFTSLRIKGCPSSAFKDTVLQRIIPLVSSAYFLGLAAEKHLQKEAYTKTQIALEKALELTQSSRVRAKNLLLLAEVFAVRKSFRTARLIALQADQAYPEWGEPWLFQAELFLNSAPLCNFSELERKALYWLAIDFCEKAQNINEGLSLAASSRIAHYSKQCPSTEEFRFHGYKVGDSFPIACWIGETTQVRY